MKKYGKKIIFVLSFFLILYIPYIVHAETVDNMIAETEGITAPFGFHMPDVIRNILSGEFSLSFAELLTWVKDLFFGEITKELTRVFQIVAAGLLSAAVVYLPEDKRSVGGFASVLLVAFMALGNFSYAKTLTEEAETEMMLFVQSLMPVAASAVAASGSVSGGGAVWMFSAMQVFSCLLRCVMLPLVTVITLLAVCDGLGEEGYIKGMVDFLKKAFRWGTGLLLLLYGAAAGIKSGASAVFDGLAGKTVKYAVGNLIPVVGGALADSLETVMMGAKAIRGALGIGGIVGVCFVAVMPLLKLAALAASYQVAGVVISLCGEKKTVQIVTEIGNGILRLLAILLSAAVMFIITISMLCFMGGGV
ncbi:MAG: stage III sporulation protein AE [Clostridia bacterium]|nr:stage III sporulation protein AE [Clostridia bacterium]